MTQEPIPDNVLRKIQEGAAGLRAAGIALTNRVKAFEVWLGKLPGRVEASCLIGTVEDGSYRSYLSFEKEGKEWSLYTYDYYEHSETVHDRKLLRDASIREKTIAIDLFPRLLQAMVKAQRSIVDDATQSLSTFDAFAKSIGLKEGE
jgi:hypothetical protein